MSFFSPLRYPGGKNRLSRFIDSICVDNNISGHYIEPYAGGASVALYLLLTNRVKEITINDLDRALYSFWFTAIHHTDALCRLVEAAPITPTEWKKQKMILANKDSEADVVRLGFATLFLNRTNFSGVLNGGMIGGKNQTGEYKIDCRFNKADIIAKIQTIAAQQSRIHVTNLDAVELIKQISFDKNTIFYFDPPYYFKGPSLYMNHYNYHDHKEVSEAIKSISDAKWIVSYDNTDEIQDLYSKHQKINYSFNHSASHSRQGRETIFFSHDLIVNLNTHPVTLAIANG